MTFTSDWLALREPADAAARSGRLTQLAGERLLRREIVRVLDLAAGTGANMRYLANRLPSHQAWLLADYDRLLLDRTAGAIRAWAEGQGIHVAAPADSADSLKMSDGTTSYELRMTEVDLADWLNPALFSGSDLVTASALLDLVSEPWLRALTRRCREVEAVVLFALSYDGRIECAPNEVEDDRIRNLVNAHQRTNKGFGAALGPASADAAVRLLSEAGYHVERETSDWMLGPEHRELQQQLLEGWVDAAAVMAPDQNGIIQNWRARRLAHVDAGRSQLIVGHEDVVGWVND
jgi:hypothetical protein